VNRIIGVVDHSGRTQRNAVEVHVQIALTVQARIWHSSITSAWWPDLTGRRRAATTQPRNPVGSYRPVRIQVVIGSDVRHRVAVTISKRLAHTAISVAEATQLALVGEAIGKKHAGIALAGELDRCRVIGSL